MQLGKMYLVKQHFWLLYPTKELAVGSPSRASPVWGNAPEAYQNAKWLSERYHCNVPVVEKNTCFVFFEQDNYYFKVLNSNGNVGWICCLAFSDYFELVKE